jgi:hypothetical protein
VNLPPHRLAQGSIDELVAGDAAQAGELTGDDTRRKMRVVGRFDLNVRAGKTRADEISNLLGSHAAPSYRTTLDFGRHRLWVRVSR